MKKPTPNGNLSLKGGNMADFHDYECDICNNQHKSLSVLLHDIPFSSQYCHQAVLINS